MESMDFEESIIAKAVWLYYMENMTQQEVSNKLGLSRMKIIKLLEKARSLGFVQFKIHRPLEKRLEIEKDLINNYNLKNAIVIPTPQTKLNDSLAKATAQYLENYMQPNCYINVSSSETVSKAMNIFVSNLDQKVSLVSLTGGVSYYTSSSASLREYDYSDPMLKTYITPCPLLLSNEELAKRILEEPPVKEVMNLVSMAHMSVVGIGAVSEKANVFRENKLTHNDLALLRLNGAVGDILGQFYDKNGDKIDSEIHNRLIATSLSTLKNLDNVIGVAGGPIKVNAIHAALKGKYFQVLITDEKTAIDLIALKEQDN